MREDEPLDLERLKELVGEPSAPAEEGEFVHQLTVSAPTTRSLKRTAAAAVAAIEASKGPRRKYSTDTPPPAVVIGRTRGGYLVLALVVSIAIVVGYRALHRPPPVPGDPVDLVAVLSPAAVASPGLAPEWSVTRGVSDSLSERGRAVRVGALLVEFERASARGDSTAQRWADAIAALLADQPDGIDVAAVFGGGGAQARSAAARRALAPLIRAAPMAVGGWLQAARVAALAGDLGFFAGTKTRESMAMLLAMPGASPEVAAARDQLDTLLRRRGRPPFPTVTDALDLIQRELAN